MENYSYSKYPKRIAYAEISSPRQVKRVSEKNDEGFCDLAALERKQLKRSQFAFGTIYPYTFDGLTYIATHHKELSKKYGKELIKEAADYYYQIELPLDDFVHYCLFNWTGSRRYLIDELLKRGKDEKPDDCKFFRYIQIAKGDYVSARPLIIFFRYKPQTAMTNLEIQRLKQIGKFDIETRAVHNIVIQVIKPFLNPILHKGIGHGWFSVPNALQAKIDTHLKFNPNPKLTSLFLRKYYLYLNTLDSSNNNSHMLIDAVDLWEHVSPSEVRLIREKYKYVHNWKEAAAKLKSAHHFFHSLKLSGALSGSKLQPAIATGFPDGIAAYKNTQKYKIYYGRSPNILKKHPNNF
jgi:hypothetical protein